MVFTTAGWWGQFWANLAADLVVALVVGIVLAQYLGIRSERQKRHSLRQKSLELVLNELRANRRELERLQEGWSRGEFAISDFETEAWRLASQNQLLQGLDTNLAGVLLKTYVRLANMEKRSRLFLEFYTAWEEFRDDTKGQKELLKTLAKGARICSKQLEKAIQALAGQSAE